VRVLLFVATVLGTTAWGQSVRLDGPLPKTVLVGRTTEIRLECRGIDRDARLEPLPVLDGLTARVSRPSIAPSGGVVSWTIRLKAWRPGAFEIPPFRILSRAGVLEAPATRIAVDRDPVGEDHVRIRLRPEGPWKEPGRIFDLVLVVEYDTVFFAEKALQLFRRPLEVPLELSAPWWDAPGDLEPIPSERGESGSGPTLVLNGHVVKSELMGTVTVEGRTFTRLALRRRVRAPGPGVFRLPNALARFAHATRFREDFLSGRVPVDRRDAFAWSRAILLDTSPVKAPKPTAAPILLPPPMALRGLPSGGGGVSDSFVRGVLLLVMPILLVGGALVLSRRWRRTWGSPSWRRVHAAVRHLQKAPSDTPDELLNAYREYLAARLGWKAQQIVDPELSHRLRATGLDENVVRRAAGLMMHLSGAAYGGGRLAAPELAEVAQTVGELERGFRSLETGS